MNEQEQNIAIAESMGWTEIEDCTCTPRCKRGKKPDDKYSKWHLPSYTTDLNACHEFEETLSDSEYEQYAERLIECGEVLNNPRLTLSACAGDRCENYLKTKGLWKEGYGA
jgi:hypothetical protein